MRKTWLKAILLLPFNVTVIIPIILLWYTDYQWCIPTWEQIILGVMIFCSGLGLFIKTSLFFHKMGQGTLSPLAPPKRLIIQGPYLSCIKPSKRRSRPQIVICERLLLLLIDSLPVVDTKNIALLYISG